MRYGHCYFRLAFAIPFYVTAFILRFSNGYISYVIYLRLDAFITAYVSISPLRHFTRRRFATMLSLSSPSPAYHAAGLIACCLRRCYIYISYAVIFSFTFALPCQYFRYWPNVISPPPTTMAHRLSTPLRHVRHSHPFSSVATIDAFRHRHLRVTARCHASLAIACHFDGRPLVTSSRHHYRLHTRIKL